MGCFRRVGLRLPYLAGLSWVSALEGKGEIILFVFLKHA